MFSILYVSYSKQIIPAGGCYISSVYVYVYILGIYVFKCMHFFGNWVFHFWCFIFETNNYRQLVVILLLGVYTWYYIFMYAHFFFMETRFLIFDIMYSIRPTFCGAGSITPVYFCICIFYGIWIFHSSCIVFETTYVLWGWLEYFCVYMYILLKFMIVFALGPFYVNYCAS